MGLKDFIRMKRVPKNLEDCYWVFEQEFDEETIQQFKELEEKDMMAVTHHSLGRWLRNNWGLWDEKTELHRWFKNELGIFHADDMSGIILTSMHRKLNGKDIDLEGQVEFYQNYWKAKGFVYEGKHSGSSKQGRQDQHR